MDIYLFFSAKQYDLQNQEVDLHCWKRFSCRLPLSLAKLPSMQPESFHNEFIRIATRKQVFIQLRFCRIKHVACVTKATRLCRVSSGNRQMRGRDAKHEDFVGIISRLFPLFFAQQLKLVEEVMFVWVLVCLERGTRK